MVNKRNIAIGVKVKLNSSFKEKCIGDKFLRFEPILFISDSFIMNDEAGESVYINGGSLGNSGRVYLTEIDLEFDYHKPQYYFDDNNEIVWLNKKENEL
jgi:hypothetical protein